MSPSFLSRDEGFRNPNDFVLPEGFISHHPKNGIHGLLPNVYHPMAANHLDPNGMQPLYEWGNHKVIDYNGVLYDPSYRTISTPTCDRWSRSGSGATSGGGGQFEVRVATPNAERGWLHGQVMYVRLDPTVGRKGPYRDIQ